MSSLKNNDEGFTGLEAAIVLIAFVVVAAVFSYVVLGAGFFTTQKAQETVHTSVQQASSTLEIVGNVYG
ncbi:MAG: archaellin/type IV pilin N-terminal domain-containing protein, partial [Methanoregula sp.]